MRYCAAVIMIQERHYSNYWRCSSPMTSLVGVALTETGAQHVHRLRLRCTQWPPGCGTQHLSAVAARNGLLAGVRNTCQRSRHAMASWLGYATPTRGPGTQWPPGWGTQHLPGVPARRSILVWNHIMNINEAKHDKCD